MGRRSWGGMLAVMALVVGSGVVSGAQASAAAPDPARPRAHAVAEISRSSSAKTPTSHAARTDAALLRAQTAAPVPVLIKLSYDPVSTYTGEIAGYPATSPSATGEALHGGAAERRYATRIRGLERAFVARLRAKVPHARVRTRLRTVYGGLAATIPANRVADVLAIPGVTAVQRDRARRPNTDASPGFVGARTIYPGVGGKAKAGRGVIVGMLDTGVWPEHPSFASASVLDPPPPKADGTARACDFGDNPRTSAADPFTCNNKIIGGEAFLSTYLSDPDRAAAETYRSARDSQGHGTHTASTAAGSVVDPAVVQGADRGRVHGVAPGAWLSIYKVCGAQGCYASDVVAAVQQAILDGVNVINYSVGGGHDPAADPVELSFLDAYAAGVFVSTAAGNNGPDAGTVDHLAPWVTTVGGSTQLREFTSSLLLRSHSGGSTATITGASLSPGVGPVKVVLGSAAPYLHRRCDAPAAIGSLLGKIVVCERGDNPVVEKSANVARGGAVGMVLYNTTESDLRTENFWVPTISLASGDHLREFLAAHVGSTATITSAVAGQGQPDVLARFSGRGPAGTVLKPDLTAPGVQILAGQTPTPDSVASGPPGQYFQAASGTSMAAPHVAGSAALLKALHPDWTPGQLKSALMTTATRTVLRPDGVTPADPLDIGAGRIALAGAPNPGLTFDETATRMARLAGQAGAATDLNLPSIEIPALPGRVTTWRTATNVTDVARSYQVQTTSPEHSYIAVNLAAFTVNAGSSVQLTITVGSSLSEGRHFGEIRLVPDDADLPTLHLPVAFAIGSAGLDLTTECDPGEIAVGEQTTCTVTATNVSPTGTVGDLTTRTDDGLTVVDASGATVLDAHTVVRPDVALPAIAPGEPSLAPGTSPAGYTPLADLGVPATPIGDEEIINFRVPSFVYNGLAYDTVGVDSNGYLVVGGGEEPADNRCCAPLEIPSLTRPNNVLAPFWTDLDGTSAPGVFAAVVDDGARNSRNWIVVEWQVDVYRTSSNRHFQVWLRPGSEQGIFFVYDPDDLPTDPDRQPFLIGAENAFGSGGARLPAGVLPTGDLVVTSSVPVPVGVYRYTVTLRARAAGTHKVTTVLKSPLVAGATIATSTVAVGDG